MNKRIVFYEGMERELELKYLNELVIRIEVLERQIVQTLDLIVPRPKGDSSDDT